MGELIRALTILSHYMRDNYYKEFPTQCEHDVLYVRGVKLSQMDVDTVNRLIELGFTPGSPYDTNYYWENLTQEEWEQRWPFLTDCFHSYKYGSC